jgi:radical SAM superfamily enzyme
MNRLVIALAGTVLGGSAVFASSTAIAADPAHASWSAKRQFASQVINCMRKRMANDKYISYNQAARICKDEVSKQTVGADTGPLVAADGKN